MCTMLRMCAVMLHVYHVMRCSTLFTPVTSMRSSVRVEPCLYITYSHFVYVTCTSGVRECLMSYVLSLALASTPLCARAKEAQGTRDLLRACPPHRQLLDTTEPGVQSGSLAGMESAGASHLVRRRLPFREHETASTFSGAPTSV